MAVGVTVEVKLRFESVVSTGRHTREGAERGVKTLLFSILFCTNISSVTIRFLFYLQKTEIQKKLRLDVFSIKTELLHNISKEISSERNCRSPSRASQNAADESLQIS